MQEYGYRSTAEAKKMVEDVQIESHQLDITEREAAEILKVCLFGLLLHWLEIKCGMSCSAYELWVLTKADSSILR